MTSWTFPLQMAALISIIAVFPALAPRFRTHLADTR